MKTIFPASAFPNSPGNRRMLSTSVNNVSISLRERSSMDIRFFAAMRHQSLQLTNTQTQGAIGAPVRTDSSLAPPLPAFIKSLEFFAWVEY
ncbi:hypothetical protein [Acidovorax sp. NCPPB 3576]|uniref:hypothetical protein n=1 Tax=Acidovorax sp. NCPPB 3576 TaxID=2940488 RepID=UPI0023495D14|nr:hypothetical protein [Acidovorax sp. NCPPB 3576]WCM91007.1 hypothetical protein M5C98_06500 [Acidovorax sp. NCPPB 3576]